jgi:hypothetical protein
LRGSRNRRVAFEKGSLRYSRCGVDLARFHGRGAESTRSFRHCQDRFFGHRGLGEIKGSMEFYILSYLYMVVFVVAARYRISRPVEFIVNSMADMKRSMIRFDNEPSRLLRGKSATLEILPNGPNRHFYAEPLPDQLLHSIPRPQGKRKFHLVRCFINQRLTQVRFPTGRKCTLFSCPAPSFPQFDRLVTLLFVTLPYRAGSPYADSKTFRYDLVPKALFLKNELPASWARIAFVNYVCVHQFFYAYCTSYDN